MYLLKLGALLSSTSLCLLWFSRESRLMMMVFSAASSSSSSCFLPTRRRTTFARNYYQLAGANLVARRRRVALGGSRMWPPALDKQVSELNLGCPPVRLCHSFWRDNFSPANWARIPFLWPAKQILALLFFFKESGITYSLS